MYVSLLFRYAAQRLTFEGVDVLQYHFEIMLDPNVSDKDSFIPTLATDGSGAYDVRAACDETVTLYFSQRYLMPLGFALSIDNPSVGALLLPRSGLGHKQGIILGNGVGLIDSDYQGQVYASLFHTKKDAEPFRINRGDRIAQILFVPLIHPTFYTVNQFSIETERGTGGFGHTEIT